MGAYIAYNIQLPSRSFFHVFRHSTPLLLLHSITSALNLNHRKILHPRDPIRHRVSRRLKKHPSIHKNDTAIPPSFTSNCSGDDCEKMDDYIVGTFFAILFGIILVYVIRVKSTEQKNRDRGCGVSDIGYEIRSDPTNGECRSEKESDPDVIIVGAGVAGAALAYTLGKVSFN